MHKTTLEQWALLEKVIALGSFARAAEETHRSQSSVSYNLALLQERLGVTLLTPSGRRAVLTPAGELLRGRMTVMGKDPVGDEKGIVIASHDLLDEAGRLVFSCLTRAVFSRR